MILRIEHRIPDAPDCTNCDQLYKCIDGAAHCIVFRMTPLEVMSRNYTIPCKACLAARMVKP